MVEKRKLKMKVLMMDSFQNPSRAKIGGSKAALVRLSSGPSGRSLNRRKKRVKPAQRRLFRVVLLLRRPVARIGRRWRGQA